MNKKVLLLFAVLISMVSFAQQETKLEFNKNTNLINATYFHDNGMISQTGTYTLDGKLQGTWTSYNLQGEKLAVGNYDNGLKVGKWFFWSDDTLKEVDFNKSKITNVNEWKSDSKLAIH